MTQETPQPQAVFKSQLLDASGQPYLVKNSAQCDELSWILVNNQNLELVVTPFPSGKVDENQYHFVFEFGPGALTKTPTLDGWDVYAVKDNDGRINSLYIALSGSKPLRIEPGKYNKAALTYSDANPKDPKVTKIDVSLTTGPGHEVTLGGNAIPNKTYSFQLTVVEANTPTLSVPPLAVDFVGRRTVLNDGQSTNSFTFALTNMTQADIGLTKDVIFTVWFDAAPNESDQGYPWALARIQDLTDPPFKLTAPSDWQVTPFVTMVDQTPVNTQWQFNVTKDFVLKQQDPVFFKFSGLKTNLDPGVARMYLRFEALPGFRPGVLIAELEKTPLLYGTARGQGLYLSAGKPAQNTPPAPSYDSGLFVQQFGTGAAAIFNGGKVGIGTGTAPPAAKLHIVDANQNPDQGTLILGSGNPNEAGLRFGCTAEYAWIQAHAGKPLAINPTPRNVGIGTSTPGSSLSVVGGVAIGTGYAQTPITIAPNNLAIEGSVGIGTAAPGSSLSVDGGVAIGKTFAPKTPSVAANNLAVEGSVGIGTTTPDSQLHVKSRNGIRLSLEGNGGGELFISNAPNDKSVQLVAISPDQDLTSADALYLGGWSTPHPQLPKMVLNAKEVEIQATLLKVDGDVHASTATVDGKVNAAGLALTGGITITGKKNVNNVLEFGFGVSGKEVSAGKIGYQVWTDGLDIVGAGDTGKTRQVHVFDDLYVHGNIWQFIPYYDSWMYLWPTGSSSGAWYNKPSDQRLKRDVRRVPDALDKIRRLCGVSFCWNEDALQRFTRDIETGMSAGPSATEEENQKVWQAERERRRHQLDTTQVGVIAQDVESVLPEAVTTDEDGFKSVNYQQLIALLIEAIKEQDVAVTAQAAIAARQQIEIEELKQALLTADPQYA